MNVLCVCLLRTAPMCSCSHCLDTVSTLSKKKHKRVLNDWRSILFWWKTTAWNHSEIFLPLARALGVVFFRERFEFHHLLFPKSPRTLGPTTCNVLTTWTLVPYDRGTQLYRRKITLIFVISSGYQRLVGFSVKVTAKVNVLFNFDLPSDNILLQIAEESDLCVLILFTARVLLGELHSNMRNRLFE